MKSLLISDIKKNFIYNVVYQLLTMIVPLVTTPYISRVLGSEGIGRYSYAYSIAYYFVIFALLGVNNYGNRCIAEVRENFEKRSKVFWSIYAFQGIIAIISILGYILFIIVGNDDIKIVSCMLLYVISAAFDINWFFFGMEQFKVTVIRNAILKLVTVVCIFIFVKQATDVYVYTLIFSSGMLLSQLYLWVKIRIYIRFVPISVSDMIIHIRPNLVLFIPVLAIGLYKYMDKIMLGVMSSKIEVGYFESCEKVILIPIALINALGMVMLPRITNMLANNKRKETETYLHKSMLFTMFVVTSMSFGIMAVAKEFVPIFYGPGFEKCILLFQVLLPSCWFLAFANVIRTQYLIPNKKDNVYIIAVIVGALVNIAVNFILIPICQSIGAAVATVCAEAAVCIMQCIGIRKELNTKKYVVYTLPFLLVGFGMYVLLINLTLPIESIVENLFIKIVIGIAIYATIIGVVVFYKKKILL